MSPSPKIGIPRDRISRENQRYLAQPVIMQSRELVLQWIRLNEKMYPRISFMARDNLGITSTSVPSESAFSVAGATITPRRGTLADDAIQAAISELVSHMGFNEKKKL